MKNFKTRFEIKSMDEYKIFDARFNLNDLGYGLKSYETLHCKNSVFLDLAKDLSGDVKAHGGRHPLPDKEKFQEKLRACGLNMDQSVLIYDDGDNVSAGRLWWMLKYYGVKQVFILHGGFKEFNNMDLTKERRSFQKGTITLVENPNMVASYQEVKTLAKSGHPVSTILVDSRDADRYRGEVEPIDKKKGHIPNAKNIFYKNHFDGLGRLKEKEILDSNFKELEPNSDVVFYCGSGVTACSNIVVYDELGYASRLYLGSFSDYISYDENQVVKK